MSIPVLVRSVGPEPSAGYYTQWTTFEPGYPKFKNQDTGAAQAFFAGDGVTLTAYRAHYLYFTGQIGEIVDRTVEFNVGLIPGEGQYYDIPVTGYDPGSTGFNPNPGSSSGTAQPSGPARLDITVSESFALSTGDAKVTPWHLPRFTQERAVSGAQWANLSAAQSEDYAAVASVPLAASLTTELLGQNFGFALPSGAQINGIEVEVTRKVLAGAAEKRQMVVSGRNSLGKKGISYGEDWYNFSFVKDMSAYTAFQDLAYSNGVWIAIPWKNASAFDVFRSVDGKNWALISVPLLASAIAVGGIAGSGNTWLATINYNRNLIRSTDGGQTWSASTLPGGTNVFGYRPATDGAGTWVIGGSDGSIVRSTDDGATWSAVTAPFSGQVHSIVWSGSKFVAEDTTGAVANSPTGATWTARSFGISGPYINNTFNLLPGGVVAMIDEGLDDINKRLVYSSDGGDTWTAATMPTITASYGPSNIVYDSANSIYRFMGAYAGSWNIQFESVDFPPTAFRRSEYLGADNGDWQNYFYHASDQPTVADKYGLSFEAVHLLAPSPVSGQIFDEGYAVPGGPFAYGLAGLFEGRDDAGLTTWNVASFGGDGMRGADASLTEGTRTWTTAEINDPAFGVGYFARGQQGTLEVAFIRARIHYRADITNDTLPAKRSNGLSGVAESPAGVKVAVGVDGKILRKPANSPTWDAIASGTTISLNAVEWVGDRFIAVGLGGIALDGGADGSAWTRVQTGAATSLWAIRRIPDTLRAVAVGNDDLAFERSRLGVWSV